MASNAVRAAADRAEKHRDGECPACGAELVDGRVPMGYDDPHCVHCAARIEDRTDWHAERGPHRGGF